jgi:hypothetical protein
VAPVLGARQVNCGSALIISWFFGGVARAGLPPAFFGAGVAQLANLMQLGNVQNAAAFAGEFLSTTNNVHRLWGEHRSESSESATAGWSAGELISTRLHLATLQR